MKRSVLVIKLVLSCLLLLKSSFVSAQLVCMDDKKKFKFYIETTMGDPNFTSGMVTSQISAAWWSLMDEPVEDYKLNWKADMN